ncbi:hypothetical protein LTR37_009788 [Vermiconidia calcicola]|uniref:Uncharacterized protein n=1 Tax=Vermiconidia calcicola TaxID=1690605 RepID=A0ACC3N7Y4_9PEZI|nr:hypothetical protein LTR37_009788 [Vermiconidia calcicola]
MPGVEDDRIAAAIDIRTDAPRYNVYVDGKLQKQATTTLEPHWDTSDHVAFLIGCSYTFEKALTVAGLTPPHMLHGRSTFVVSMRMYRSSEVDRVRGITRPYVTTHGEPIAWGWEGMRSIGIDDISKVDWGEPPVSGAGLDIVQAEQEAQEDGLVPVFWGCGVTPQEAVMKAQIPGTVMSHTPGYMIVLDVEEEEVIGKVL